MAAIEYLIVDHLSTKQLIRVFSKVTTHDDMWFNGTPCWIWCGNRTSDGGYGHVRFHGKTITSHRLMFAWLVHSLPIGHKHKEIDHLCKVRACCNPLHLEFVTIKVNVHRSDNPAAKNARKTHCPKGHALSGINLYAHPLVQRRSCLTCLRIYQRDWQRSNRERVRAANARYRKRHPERIHERNAHRVYVRNT